ncbi:lamin tail domain-containing protein [Lacinutrix mariniflava]|uniref:lamin tail domain-containing protein n=1 Tax=Lacinutrix mariniflava TaxID=342955 RepID=UPI0006E2BE2C|nr:lamin tail domain-containing protein [Lacinutrix mariniflava]
MKKFTILLIILFVFSFGYSQTTIYSEDFTGQLGKGASYNTTTGVTETDLSGVNWTIDVSATSFVQVSDWFRVLGGNRYLEARDVDGTAIWYSPLINISAFSNIQFSFDATESSPTTNNLEPTDTFRTEFRIDGGAWTQAGSNGFIQDDYVATVVSHNALLNGNTIELRMLFTNNDQQERMRIDNILVEGITPTTPTITINPGTNTIPTLSNIENNVPLISETFTVQGSALTNDIAIAVTPLSNFVIATAINGPYTNTITLPQVAGTINTTTIYTQLAFGLPVNTYNESISISSTGATTEMVTASGTIVPHSPALSCNELLISEYHEADSGTPNEQYIELYNPTNTAITLSNYQIARFRNGRVNFRPDIRTIPAGQGTIAPYSTFLIARNNSTLCNNGMADYCNGSNVMNFDGNDVIALQNSNGVNIDVIGVLGVNNQFGENVNLVRNSNIQVAEVTYNAVDWSSTPSNNTSMLGWHINDCQCPSTTTWETTGWDNGIPNASTAAIINAPYTTSSTTNITACSLTVNNGIFLTVTDFTFLDIENNIIVLGNGNINVQKNGSVVQNNPNASSIITDPLNGIINVTKETAFIKAWYEYTYWSSPVVGETIGNTFSGTNLDRRFTFNGGDFADEYAEDMNDNNGTVLGQDDVDDNGNAWQLANSAQVMQPGVGYACTLSPASFNAANSLPGGPFLNGIKISHIFNGPFNSGTINTPIERNNTTMADNNWNFIGNPYPSAISIDNFFTLNAYSLSNTAGTIDGAIYLWSQDTAPSATTNGNSALNFDTSDYAIVNITGATGALEVEGGDTVIPSRFIPSGQGFFVNYNNSGASINTTAGVSNGEVIFDNSMRVTGNNDQFFRNNQPIQDNKIWLELTSDNGVYGQILVGYVPNATDDDDDMSYDAVKNKSTGYASFLYSTIPGSDKKFGIQGKAISSLDLNEEIPLGLYTTITEPTLYKISVLQFEGDFFANNTVYLEDALMNTIHDLTNSDYTFTSAVGEFNDRFKIVFNTNTLSTENFESNSQNLSIVELQNNDVKFSIASKDLTIKRVKILDVLGREIYYFRGSEKTETYNLSNLSSSIYIAKIELSNGSIITKKAIKK